MTSPAATAGNDSPEGPRRAPLVACAVILLAAGAVRFAAGRGSLWLDEIWTLDDVRLRVASIVDIFTMGEENNHYLNTLVVWLLGPEQEGIAFRIPAMIAGVAAVAFAGLVARPRGTPAALFAMLLVGGSYLQIHYSSEARGYAYAVCFALGCLACQERVLGGGGVGAAAGTAICAIAGVTAQPVFLAFYGAVLVWSAWRTWRATSGRRRLIRSWWICHGPPLLFSAFLYVLDMSTLRNAGGPIYPLWRSLKTTISLAAGGPEASVACAIGATAAFAGALYLLRRSDPDWCVLAVLAVIVMPALLLIVTGRREVYPRYFVIPAAVVYLTWAIALGRMWQAGAGSRRWLCGAAAALFLAANGVHVARLVEYGRGAGVEVMRFLAEQTEAGTITVAGDHDFRNALVLLYYSRYLPESKRLVYFPQTDWPAEGPEWFFAHSLERGVDPPAEFETHGRRYHLARHWPHAGLSGWSWAVYRRE